MLWIPAHPALTLRLATWTRMLSHFGKANSRKSVKIRTLLKRAQNLGFVVQYVGSEEGTKRMHNWFDTKLPVFVELGFAQ